MSWSSYAMLRQKYLFDSNTPSSSFQASLCLLEKSLDVEVSFSLIRGIFFRFVDQPERERVSQPNPAAVSVSGEF
ncbi:hypothetical protein E5288_WYG016403 [Bos mutus]|uniref:Uncharacterized protein n=1 Tax=Bos mutus TaxID=72004 RepID=A0A6B0R6I8_9CETA|nr:hypothetical protein [Bos mutus]